jgi:hypothetical protein
MYYTVRLSTNHDMLMAVQGIALCERMIKQRDDAMVAKMVSNLVDKAAHVLLVRRRLMFSRLSHARGGAGCVLGQLPHEVIAQIFTASE